MATEAVQTGLPPETRLDRIMPVADQLRGAFGRLREGVEEAVAAAEAAGLDQQSRFGTQSLGIARMEAMMEASEASIVVIAVKFRPRYSAFWQRPKMIVARHWAGVRCQL